MGCGLHKGAKGCATIVPTHDDAKAPSDVHSSASSELSSMSQASNVSVLGLMPTPAPLPPGEGDIPERYFKRERRVSYSSESTSDGVVSFVTHPKTDGEKARLKGFIMESENFLFSGLNPSKVSMIVNAMFKIELPANTQVITQGSVDADNFYILDEGRCDIFISRNGGPEQKVKEITRGKSFGELALLYMCPRAASVRTTCKSTLWALEREQFRSLVVTTERSEKRQYEQFLSNIEVLSELNQYERITLADALEVNYFKEGEDAIQQGDEADHLFILESGAAQAILECEGKDPVILQEYRTPGDVFGELALLNESKRNATVRCIEAMTCLRVSRRDFEGLLGPIHEILRRRAELYVKYKSALAELPNRRYSAVQFCGTAKTGDDGREINDDEEVDAIPSLDIAVAARRMSNVVLDMAATETARENNLRLQCAARQLLQSYYATASRILQNDMVSSPQYREQFPAESSYDHVISQKRASRRKTKENIPDVIIESEN